MQRLHMFWPLHHLAFKFLNMSSMLTFHVMCSSLHELLCILLIMSCNALMVCHEVCKSLLHWIRYGCGLGVVIRCAFYINLLLLLQAWVEYV